MRRLLPLLIVCSLAPLVLAQSADLSVTVTMPSTAVYLAQSPSNAAYATGQLTITNAGPSAAQNVTIDLDTHSMGVSLSGFSCNVTNGHYRCTAASMAPGSVTAPLPEWWPLASAGTVETTTVTLSSASPADPNAGNNSASANTTVVWQADLQLTRVDPGPPTAPGNYVNVNVYYKNDGPSPASDFKLTITVPPGVTYAGYSADAWLTCTEPPKGGQGNLVCTTPNLGVLHLDDYYVDLFVHVDPATLPGTTITFPATLTSTTAIQPTQTNSGSLSVIDPADLHVEMSAPASAHPGDTFLNTVTVTNQGPGAALKPEVRLTVTPGIPYGVMTAPAGWECLLGSCSISSFAAGTTATFTFPTTIPWNASAGTVTAKVAAIASNVPYFDPNNVATASTVVSTWPPSSLKLTMTASPDVVYTGDQLTYTATIANTGNADAKNVQLSWSLPGTVTATTCGTIGDSVCTFATIAAGATLTATRTVHVEATAGLPLTAQATVKAANVAYDAQSASATVTTPVAGIPHVNLRAVIVPPNAPRAGGTWRWSYRVYNDGPDAATDWQLSFPIPPNTTLIDGSFATGIGTCVGLTPNAANTRVTCHGTYLSASSDFELVVDLAITPGTTAPIHATETVSTSNDDPYPQDNTATADTAVTSAELVASLTEDKTTAVFGERVTQTLTVTNNGPDTSSNIVVQVSLPVGAVNAIINSTSLSCIAGTQPIHCTAAPLENGAALTATISFEVPARAASLRTQADVFWVDRGFNTGTTAAIEVQAVPPPPASDVTISVDAAPSTLNTGDTVTYTIAATNLGLSPASNVTVDLDLPASLVLLSASPQCSGGPLVTCTAGTLNSGTPATFTVTARAVEAGTIKTLASVSTTSEESNNGNNTASATITVNAAAPPPARRRAARH